ncbi:MAG: HNH endonuclease [Dasosvirus sp.]|uniref:HNH endonuclease n=1 Tax=Dasosvirus sp. TaxID=2487764 RepID=A0A3G4ZT64_9VIRU|nr:MAG: HNH endonuclease [Dasosvirus sp.]
MKKNHRYLENRGRIHPSVLPINDEGFRMCRYCNGNIYPPRRTFCSDTCVHEYRIRTDGKYLREQVFRRDNGICNICGIDTKEIANLILSSREEDREKIMKLYNINKNRKVMWWNAKSLWDADHIVPVKNGGGACGIENIRTLCPCCHKIITFSK